MACSLHCFCAALDGRGGGDGCNVVGNVGPTRAVRLLAAPCGLSGGEVSWIGSRRRDGAGLSYRRWRRPAGGSVTVAARAVARIPSVLLVLQPAEGPGEAQFEHHASVPFHPPGAPAGR